MTRPDDRAGAPPVPPNIAWSWSNALRGAVCVAPAALVAIADVPSGLAMAVGVLPAMVTGLPPTRRARLGMGLIGILVGLPIFLGSVVADLPVVAVSVLFVAAMASVEVARRRPRAGQALMTLGLPMFGVGLSYTDVGEAAGLALLIAVGSVFAAVVSMAWPESPTRSGATPTSSGPSRAYGVQLGLAGATAAAIGFALDFDHVGWATAACLLVMRPMDEMQRLRSTGRIAAVAVGAVVAGGLAHLTTAPGWYSVAIVVAVAAAAASAGSRWYFVPTFTTFLALSLLIYSQPDTELARFNERMAETLLGVAIAYLFGPGLARVSAAIRHH